MKPLALLLGVDEEVSIVPVGFDPGPSGSLVQRSTSWATATAFLKLADNLFIAALKNCFVAPSLIV